VAATAQEVSDVLTERGYRVIVQDYDIRPCGSFIWAMNEAIKNARDLLILFTGDYLQSPHTRKEFTSFEAERSLPGEQDRHIVILRCEDAPLRGLLADIVYQDLVGVTEPQERKRRIVAAAERQPSPQRPQRRRVELSSASRRALRVSRVVQTTSTGLMPFSPGQRRRRNTGWPGGSARHGRCR
jgi:hypothetical protein